MKAVINYVIEEQIEETHIRLCDGGVATLYHNGDHMLTEYHQDRCTKKELDWEALAEGKMYVKDWENKQKPDVEMIEEAIGWLGFDPKEVEIIENLLFKTELFEEVI